jgi:hypothetical protein
VYVGREDGACVEDKRARDLWPPSGATALTLLFAIAWEGERPRNKTVRKWWEQNHALSSCSIFFIIFFGVLLS